MPSSEPDSCSSPGSQTTASPDAIGSRSPSPPLTQPEPLTTANSWNARQQGAGRPRRRARPRSRRRARYRRQPPHTSAHAAGRSHVALAGEHDPPHAASSISLHASANCSSLSRMCEWRQMLCGKTPAASTGGASWRSRDDRERPDREAPRPALALRVVLGVAGHLDDAEDRLPYRRVEDRAIARLHGRPLRRRVAPDVRAAAPRRRADSSPARG